MKAGFFRYTYVHICMCCPLVLFPSSESHIFSYHPARPPSLPSSSLPAPMSLPPIMPVNLGFSPAGSFSCN